MEKYKIIRIDEADFGCEGLPDGEILKDDVVVEDERGQTKTMQISDALLYRLELDEGDVFSIDDAGNIAKENYKL